MKDEVYNGYDLAEINEELEAQKEELTAAIEELESQNKHLVDTIALLESRNLELDQIIYRTNHDLKSPITSIEGISNILRSELEGTRFNDLFDHIDKNILVFKGILNSIVKLSQSIRKENAVEAFNLYDVLSSIADEVRAKQLAESVRLRITCDKGHVLKSDRTRTQEILRAVSSNALEFGAVNKRSWVNIEANTFLNGFKISVIDNGIGMSNEVLNKATEMFYRGSENSKGAGLGLYITKRMVKLLHGELSIRSREGFGTTVDIYLPNL